MPAFAPFAAHILSSPLASVVLRVPGDIVPTSDGSISQLLALLFGGSVITAGATLLASRGGRNKAYDDRRDTELDKTRTRNDELEGANDRYREEVARLRYLLRSHGIDPDASPNKETVTP